MKYSNFQPMVIFKKDGQKRCFILFSFTNSTSFSESKLLNIDISKVSSISLVFRCFDFASKDKKNSKFVDGELFLNLEYFDNSKDLIKILDIREKIFESGKDESYLVSLLKKEMVNKWQYSFNESYIDFLNGEKNVETLTKVSSNKKNKIKINLKKIPLFIVLVCFSVISITGYAYLKKSENSKMSKADLSTDPQKLAESQKKALDQTFSELGIDREKVDSDLSCFQE